MTTTIVAGRSHEVNVPSAAKVFIAVLWRDIYVTSRQLPSFFARVALQPLLLLFIFGRVLTSLGYASADYASLLFPGILGLTLAMSAVQSIAVPLTMDFGWTKELEDRLLAPMPVWLLGLEKLVFAAVNALIAAVLTVPAGLLILWSIPWRTDGIPLLIAVLVLGSLASAAIGLTLGVIVPPARIGMLLTVIFTPLLFTGASQYPWPSLSGMRWFQILTAANPITYISEGLRAALVPKVPHIPSWICLAALAGSTVLLGGIGLWGFGRRAFD
uniref:Transport permease protein n=1 Tax=Streptomyces argenteolus TaxID=67274 RepID=A9ZNV8_9ACTN|nr:putative ABC transporter [Streptomyces argenteolus]